MASTSEAIKEKNRALDEILRIKKVLVNQQDESEKTLLACLGRLQFLKISIEILEATEIGKVVNSLRKHSSKQIQRLVKTLIEGWKVLADEWMKSRAAIAGKSNYQLQARQDVLTLPPLDAEALSKPALVPKKFSSKDVSEEQLMGTRLEIAKRKLHEGYQDAENAKKQRTIKILEINDIPGQKKKQRKPDVKPPNNIRKMLNGRR